MKVKDNKEEVLHSLQEGEEGRQTVEHHSWRVETSVQFLSVLHAQLKGFLARQRQYPAQMIFNDN